MKIAVIIEEKLNGVMFYRQVIPHSFMLRKDEVQIHFTDIVSLKLLTDEQLSEFDIVHVSYWMWDGVLNSKLKEIGIKLIIDIDDYWNVDRYHELYDYYKENNRPKKIIKTMQNADAITTTTPVLADRIKPYNSNIGTFNNALMEDDYIKPIRNEIPFAAWIGGSNHSSDLMLIQHLQKGFRIPVYIPDMYRPVFKDKFLYYQRQDIPNYLSLYNSYEIILSPLRKSKFNGYKSPLKVMEAGMFSKPLIVSDVDPFTQYLKHKENCLVVRKKSEWGKFLKLLVNDEEMRNELGRNLNKDIIREINLPEITERRWKFYLKVTGIKEVVKIDAE